MHTLHILQIRVCIHYIYCIYANAYTADTRMLHLGTQDAAFVDAGTCIYATLTFFSIRVDAGQCMSYNPALGQACL